MPAPVAVIDIGSNSIKILVATRTPEGQVVSLKMKTIDARISAGISRAQPRLTDGGMLRGVNAVKELLNDVAAFQPASIALVATSAVRDAGNGAEFCESIRVQTGHPVRILSGKEEANRIGRGLTCDPALRDLRDFYLFDLGGGSLECLAFRARQISQALSLPLGCVRMTERCVTNSSLPLPPGERQRLRETSRELLMKSGFHFDLPPEAATVGTGGTLTTARVIAAQREGKTLETADSLLSVAFLQELFVSVSGCDLDERRRIPGMAAARADVFPAALCTLIAVAELGDFTAYRHSLYNLRWGIADELLS